MKLTRLGRLAPAVAVAAFAVACADQSTPMGPSALSSGAAFDVSTSAAGEGELRICKAGNSTGTFTFDYSFVLAPGAPAATPPTSGSVNVDAGSCVSVLTITVGRFVATVTEQAPPANWALTSIAVTQSLPTVPVWAVPVTNVVTRTATFGMSNDLGAEVTFTNTYTPPPPPPSYCTLTQGYWKNHTEDWDNGEKYVDAGDTFYNSGYSYIDIMNMPPKGGNAYLQLAHQFIAASLNVNGTSGSGVAAVDAALAGADAYFAGAAAGIPSPTGATKTQLQSWASTLDQFNNGLIGPGHCDD